MKNGEEMTIEDLINLPADKYEKHVSRLLTTKEESYKVDKIDDLLLELVKERPLVVQRVCKLNEKIFLRFKSHKSYRSLVGYNLNTLMISHIITGNIQEAKSVFLKGIEFCQKNKLYHEGKSLAGNVFNFFTENKLPIDEAPFFISRINEFYKTLNKYEESVEALCAAATHFGDVGAFQSAYRAVADAQETVIAYKLESNLQLHVLQTQADVALIEGDLDCAEGEYEKCLFICNATNVKPSVQLLANVALVKFRKNDFQTAKEMYEEVLNRTKRSLSAKQKLQIKLNLLLCYRDLGQIKATLDLAQKINRQLSIFDLDELIEARLILSKTYFQLGKKAEGTRHVKHACSEIQKKLDKYFRLHYRRGIREQYIPRIKNLLLFVESNGAVSEIAHALALCTSNALLDWISVLDWVDYVNGLDTITASEKEKLSSVIQELINHGTPFLYGFREKYDDPFENANDTLIERVGESLAQAMDYSHPWRIFNDVVSDICSRHSLQSPYQKANIQEVFERLQEKQQRNSCFLFTYAIEKSVAFLIICEGEYHRFEFPSDKLWAFYQKQNLYQKKQLSRNEFHSGLTEIQIVLKPVIDEVIALLSSQVRELVLVSDHLTESLPIFPAILFDDDLRLRIRTSNLTFRTCPALTYEKIEPSFKGEAVFVFNSEEGLELTEEERVIVKKAIKKRDLLSVDFKNENLDFSIPSFQKVTALHLTSHSFPASLFSDPFFVSTNVNTSQNSIWLESVQREINNLELNLVVLNGCNTGTTSNRNFFQFFKTNEKVGLSSIFLLNRKCNVIGTQWNEPEIVGYIFCSLLYKQIANEKCINRAFTLALVDMYELSKTSAINLTNDMVDKTLGESKSKLLDKSVNEFPFRDSYVLGMFQCHGLLSKPH